MDVTDIAPHEQEYQPTDSQLERAAAIRKFNFRFVYLPIGLISLVVLLTVLALLYLALRTAWWLHKPERLHGEVTFVVGRAGGDRPLPKRIDGNDTVRSPTTDEELFHLSAISQRGKTMLRIVPLAADAVLVEGQPAAPEGQTLRLRLCRIDVGDVLVTFMPKPRS